MTQRVDITEYLTIDIPTERWRCRVCDHDLGPARANYKEGCLVADRNPHEIHDPVVLGDYTFSPDPEWCHVVEFYCPGCVTMIETEYLPPGHPLTHDIELDIDALKSKYGV